MGRYPDGVNPSVPAKSATAPLENWSAVHPAALAWAGKAPHYPDAGRADPARSQQLAAALEAANGRWGNEVHDELNRWLRGATVVVAGQQPGIFGGPLLSLVKAAAVAAEVRQRRRAGEEAVGFFWLATNDDDLPEMTWGRLALGGELLDIRIPGRRGEQMGGSLVLGPECQTFLAELEERCAGEFCRTATTLAAQCFAPGATMADAAGSFLAALLQGSGVVLVDACLPELARAGAGALAAVLQQLPVAWDVLAAGAEDFKKNGWPVPLQLDRDRLPVFRADGNVRQRLASEQAGCPRVILAEHAAHPERFLPNVWLRPLLQDAALGTGLAILGGAELAYHLQAAGIWSLAGMARPSWRLRPHATVITSGERHLAQQLELQPDDLLRGRPPGRIIGAGTTRRRLERFRAKVAAEFAALGESARRELPALQGDLDATDRKVGAALDWLERRTERAANSRHDTAVARWHRLHAFLRPGGKPQERRLSVLAPLLRLGLQWPAKLVEALDPEQPEMQLLFWEEGGLW